MIIKSSQKESVSYGSLSCGDCFRRVGSASLICNLFIRSDYLVSYGNVIAIDLQSGAAYDFPSDTTVRKVDATVTVSDDS